MPSDKPAWQQASLAAQAFWLAASQDLLISVPFRNVCANNLQILNRLVTLA